MTPEQAKLILEAVATGKYTDYEIDKAAAKMYKQAEIYGFTKPTTTPGKESRDYNRN